MKQYINMFLIPILLSILYLVAARGLQKPIKQFRRLPAPNSPYAINENDEISFLFYLNQRVKHQEFLGMSDGMIIDMELRASGKFSVIIMQNETKYDGDALFYMDARPSEKALVFNCKFENNWDTEERRLIPFAIPGKLVIRMTILPEGYHVVFNDNYQFFFNRRLLSIGEDMLYLTGQASMIALDITLDSHYQAEDNEKDMEAPNDKEGDSEREEVRNDITEETGNDITEEPVY